MKLLSLIRQTASTVRNADDPATPAAGARGQPVAEIATIAVAAPRGSDRQPSKLLNLIRRPASTLPSATAISATPSTAPPSERRPVAEVAGIAVAATPKTGRSRDDAVHDLTEAFDPSDLLDDYLERLAICAEAGDVPDSEAQRIAANQCGASLDELVGRQLEYWRHRLSQLDEPGNPRLKEVVPYCLAALEQPWLNRAVRLGWDARALFGLDSAAPKAVTRNGLVTGLVVTSLPKPLDILGIAADQALIETASGARIRHFNDGYRAAPIWEHAKFPRLH